MKTITIFIMAAAISGPAAAQSAIYKCVQGGKTLYSESPCKPNGYQENRLDVNTDPIGTVDPDRDTVEATRARIREGMNQRGSGASTGTTTTTTTTTTTVKNRTAGDKKMVCDSVKSDLANIDAQARSPQGGYSQDSLKKRKIEVQKTAIDWQC